MTEELRHEIPYKSSKSDVPWSGGSDPLGWIFEINQFFNYHHTHEDQGTIASF